MNNNDSLNWAWLEPWCLLVRVLHELWMVILSAVICALCAQIVLMTRFDDTYATRLTFVVMSRNGSSASQDISTANSVAANFSELMGTSFARRRLTESAGLSSFSGTINAANTDDTNLITVTVTADTAREAFLITRALMENYKELTNYVNSSAAITPLSSPVSYTVPGFSGSRGKVRALAALAGAAAMIAYLCWYAVWQDTIQTAKSARDKLDGKLLLSISHEKTARGKKKRPLLITEPTVSFSFTESIHKLRSQVEQRKAVDGLNLYMVASVMENEGKSMVAENLALSLAQKKYTVLIVDCDYRKPSRFCKRSGVKEAKQVDFGDTRLSFVHDKTSGLYELFSPGMMKHPLEFLSSDSFMKMIVNFQGAFDYIILDSPPLELFSDAEMLARTGAAGLLVVRQDIVPAPVINEAIRMLKNSRGGLMGVVFNDMRSILPASLRENANYGYHGYGHYGSYGKYGSYAKYAAAASEGGRKK